MIDTIRSTEVSRDGETVVLHLPPVAQIQLAETWAPIFARYVEFEFPEMFAHLDGLEEPPEEMKEACAGLADKLRQA